MNRRFYSFLAVMAVLVGACAKTPTTSPPPASNAEASLQPVVIMGINDIHGAIVPAKLKTTAAKENEAVPYTVGGAPMLAAYANRLRREYGSKFLLLDAGDQWQGTMESNVTKGKSMVELYNLMRVDAATIGNHEFDFGAENGESDTLGALRARLVEAQYPYVSANIYDKTTNRPAALANLFPHVLLKAGTLQVGVFGLTTETTPVTTFKKNVAKLQFRKLAAVASEEAKALRSLGADIVVLVAHAGAHCDSKPIPENRRFSAPFSHEDAKCDSTDEITQLLKTLPGGTLDAVISGHTHTLTHHWINGTPVIQAGKSGLHFNLLHLVYDTAQKKVRPELSEIEGPIPVCEKIFANQKDCDGKKKAPDGGRGALVDATFHGMTILPDAEATRLLNTVSDKVGKIKNEVIAFAEQPLPHQKYTESPLGNLIADAARAKAKTDVALMNSGGIRDSIEMGDITKGAVYQALPFDNFLSVVKVTGKELKMILRISQSGQRGVFPVSGVTLTLLKQIPKPTEDLNHDGKLEPWEAKRLVKATFADGTEIEDAKTYTLATPDFLVGGGDDMGWIFGQIPDARVDLMAGGPLRDMFEEYVIREKRLNSMAKPALDKAKPRFHFVAE